jgi:hypothetical protein
MSHEGEAASEIRPVPAASFTAREPFLRDERSRRSRYLTRGLIAAALALVLSLVAYETYLAPSDASLVWTPPRGLPRDETPDWLRTLCLDRTPELCAAADKARTAADCEAMRAALGSLEAVDRKLSARGAVSAQQHWVLVELYGQGYDLCQFQRAKPGAPKKAQ